MRREERAGYVYTMQIKVSSRARDTQPDVRALALRGNCNYARVAIWQLQRCRKIQSFIKYVAMCPPEKYLIATWGRGILGMLIIRGYEAQTDI